MTRILPGLPGGPPYIPATVELSRGLQNIRDTTPGLVARILTAHWFLTADQALDAIQKRTGVL